MSSFHFLHNSSKIENFKVILYSYVHHFMICFYFLAQNNFFTIKYSKE
uniref:Uncharacterized protein n=1 Tax=Parastrongyloides trichosuri TaxID=131310 RepID=A0A0N4Z3C1_PARTI